MPLPKSIEILKQLHTPTLPPTGIPLGTNTELPEGHPGVDALSLVPYLKYVNEGERERFLELSQQKQTRELLLQNLEAVVLIGGGKLYEGVKAVVSPVFKGMFPKTTKGIAKIVDAMPKKSPPEKLPKYAGSINLQRQDIPVELKLAELRVSETVPRKKVTWAEVDAKSAEVMNDPAKIRKSLSKIRENKRLTDVDHDVVRKANVEGLYNFQKKMSGAKTAKEAIAIQNAYKEQLFIPVDEFANEAGRILQGYNKEIALTRLGKAFGKLGRDLNPREMKAFKSLDLNDPTQVKGFTNELGDPKVMDYVYEYWYNSILSGIPTHVVNVSSNTLWRSFQVPHRALTGAVDSVIGPVFRGGKRDVFMNEAVPLWAGFVKGKPKAAKRAWDMMRHGKITKFEDKWAQEVGASVGAFKRSPYGVLRAVGTVIDKPTRALRTMDVYANSLAYDGQMNALAKRAWNKIPKAKRGNYKEFQKSFVENPSKAAHEEAMEFAKYSTFMSDPGKISEAILRLRNAPPGEAGRFVIPFVNTIGNLLKRGVEMTPGVGIAMARGQKPAEVIAKQIEGLLVAAAVWGKLESGEMTGAAPEGEAERKAFYRDGKKAWAIKVGDEWYQYRRIEPFNTILASATIYHQKLKNAKDEDTATDIMGKMANEFKNNLIDSSYLQGMSQLLNRHGGFETQPKRLAASMVPYSGFWRSINRSYEAAVEGQAKYRPGRDIVGAFAGVIPGLYKYSQPEITVWGEEVKLQGGVFRQWLPYKWSKETSDPTEVFLEKIKKYPGMPNQWVTHRKESLRLDDDIYRDFVISAGSKAKKKIDARVPSWQGAVQDEKKHPGLVTKIQEIMDEEWRRGRKTAIRKQRQRDALID
jgi:hypothetical protein